LQTAELYEISAIKICCVTGSKSFTHSSHSSLHVLTKQCVMSSTPSRMSLTTHLIRNSELY